MCLCCCRAGRECFTLAAMVVQRSLPHTGSHPLGHGGGSCLKLVQPCCSPLSPRVPSGITCAHSSFSPHIHPVPPTLEGWGHMSIILGFPPAKIKVGTSDAEGGQVFLLAAFCDLILRWQCVTIGMSAAFQGLQQGVIGSHLGA